jgi:P27 family predicted phage terminase small subunit
MSPGPPPKTPERRINRVTKRLGLANRVERPTMPRGLSKQAVAAWEDYWSDDVSRAVRTSDRAVVIRWIKNFDRHSRLSAEADRNPIVTGSTGQPKTNPIYSLCSALDAQIRLDEAQLGIGPLSRLRLGLVLSEQAKTLNELTEDDDDTTDFRGDLVLLPAPVAGGSAAPADSSPDT